MKNEREEEVGIDTLEKQFDREISKLLCLIMTNFQLKVSALSLSLSSLIIIMARSIMITGKFNLEGSKNDQREEGQQR